ncbi:hypothetical protein AVHM3334_01655 [Acidovorax sp. SUPP3334]|nr:hypothetical protein AVHM3334_01655 [Acidovorax sp. SUPP3334]
MRTATSGVQLAKGVQCARHDFVAQGQHAQHVQFPLTLLAAQAVGEPLHIVELVEQAFDVRVERLRLARGHEAALHAVEKRKAQLQLGMRQDAADRRLGDVDEPRGGTHAAGEHHRIEDFDVAQAHGETGFS